MGKYRGAIGEGSGLVWIEDTSIVSIDVQLTAETIGLGSCWIQIRKRKDSNKQSSEGYIKELLVIPGNMRVQSIIAVGYSNESKRPYTDENLMIEKIHSNKFGKNIIYKKLETS